MMWRARRPTPRRLRERCRSRRHRCRDEIANLQFAICDLNSIANRKLQIANKGPQMRCIALSILLFALPALAAEEWTEDSFEAFRDGTFLDAGSNAYVSANGRIQIINRWDLNNDGFLDVIMPAGH